MANNLTQENSELKNKLHIFSAVMRLTKDAFACKDLTALGIHIVNNSHILLQFDRSLLLDQRGGKSSLVAEYALAAPNAHTEYVSGMIKLLWKKTVVYITSAWKQPRKQPVSSFQK